MKIATLFAASVLSFSAFDAQAASPRDVDSITVHYADLDLERMPGIVALFQRIKGAAHLLCKPHAGENLVSKRTYMACRDLAVSTATARINRPMLSDYVAQQLGKRAAGANEQVAGR